MKKKKVLANKAIDINQNEIPVKSLDCRSVVFIKSPVCLFKWM